MLMNGWNSSRAMETEPHSLQFLGPDRSLLILPAAQEIGAVAAFSTRRGGVSPPPFDSLNLSTQEGDTPANVQKNFQALGDRLHIDPSGIAFCRQVHGETIHIIESVPERLPDGDALITSRKGLFLGIKTADCVPILLLDPVRGVAAAVHAGWRGTVLRIAGKVVRTMKSEFGTEPSDVLAALGPAIGPCCYEVDGTVLGPFREAYPGAEAFLSSPGSRNRGIGHETGHDEAIPSRSEKRGISAGASFTPDPEKDNGNTAGRMLDLVRANHWDLVSSGIDPNNISEQAFCTSCRSELFFSYRRDKPQTGRHAAVVGVR